MKERYEVYTHTKRLRLDIEKNFGDTKNFSEATGIAPSTLSQILSGHVPGKVARKLISLMLKQEVEYYFPPHQRAA